MLDSFNNTRVFIKPRPLGQLKNPPKNFCKKHAIDGNNSYVWSIEDYYDIREIIHASLPNDVIRKLWTRSIAMNSTHYYDYLGTHKFPRFGQHH